MVRAAKLQDYPSIRNICEQCFTTDSEYLDLFFKRNTSKLGFVYEFEGRVVSSAYAMGITYVNNRRSFYQGLYLYAVGTLPGYRNRGFASSLIKYIIDGAALLDWDFIIVRPAEEELIPFYQRLGFKLPVYRPHCLPPFEDKNNITDLSGTELFLLRDNELKGNYFAWSHIMLNYIIEEAKINPSSATESLPYALVAPLSPHFSLDNNAIFSFPME